ncbi:MAG: hypothetical protein RIR76_3440 [Verrucomicrobiota bacterium]|jgi:GAF domain-containing protein
MSSPVILATPDASLRDVWARQCGPGREVLRMGEDTVPGGPAVNLVAVVVLDAVWDGRLPAVLAHCPTVLVGEPRSRPFEQARLAGRAKAYLSYAESEERLGLLLPLLEELAYTSALAARTVAPAVPSAVPVGSAAGPLPSGFIAGLLERLDSLSGLSAEMRRVWREALGSSRADFFRLEGVHLVPFEGGETFVLDDGLRAWLERNPVVIDGRHWPEGTTPRAALAAENLLVRRSARLVVPLHENGRLLGVFLLGVKEDGRDFDAADRARAVELARLMRLVLIRAEELARLREVERRAVLAEQHPGGALLLAADEQPSSSLPLIVRELVGEVRHQGGLGRREPGDEQPYRVRAGLVPRGGEVWVRWEDASSEVATNRERDRRARRGLLRELALTLSHELGNALVSLATFRQAGADRPLPAAMLETMRADIVRLQGLNADLGLMQTMHEAEAGTVDLRELAQEIGRSLGLRVEVVSESAVLNADRRLLDFALRSILETIGENRGELGLRELALKIRCAGEGPETVALVSLRGRPLELEGVLPPPAEDAVPNHGHLKVLLAREILALHHGDIHAGPGMEGTEILISIRHL